MSDLFYALLFKISGILFIWHTAQWNLQNYTEKKILLVSASSILDLKKIISGVRFLCHNKPQAVDDIDVDRTKTQKGMEL